MKKKSPFEKPLSTLREYARQLRKIARECGRIIEGFDGLNHPHRVIEALERYADTLTPWAVRKASQMISSANQADLRAWQQQTKEMGIALKAEIASSPIGEAMQQLLQGQVALIRSIPLEAAQRVNRLAIQAREDSGRAADIAKEIARSGKVSEAHAMTIARTEVGRAATTLTQVRAQSIGAEQYIWRTARDSDVRPTHRKLEGKAFRWDDPPECDPGYRANPGCIFNCRCYAEPIIPQKIG